MKECNCKDWETQIKILNDLVVFASIHERPCKVIPFKHCPWCGKEL